MRGGRIVVKGSVTRRNVYRKKLAFLDPRQSERATYSHLALPPSALHDAKVIY